MYILFIYPIIYFHHTFLHFLLQIYCPKVSALSGIFSSAIVFYNKFMFYSYDDNFLNNLNKPDFQPPKWIFKYIWGVLFLLMLASFIIILLKPVSTDKYIAAGIFFLQLALNLYWTKSFFTEHNIKKALVVAIVLLILVAVMIFFFFKLSFLAGFLQIPYLLWVGFACILNKILLNLNT